MLRRLNLKAAIFMGFVVLAGTLVSACAAGVSQAEFDKLKEQLAAKETEASQAILRIKPNAPPRATPTPLPAGVKPAPKPTPAPKVVPIAFYVDTVTAGFGESQYKVDANVSCVRLSAFKRGMHVVWRMELVETSTGKVLQPADVERAVLKLPTGETRNFNYGRHGATDDSPWFWTTAWDVPPDYPLGVVDYSIEAATKSGKTGTFKEIPVRGSFLEVIQ
ncbi:MAG: hypothetical protein HYX92_21950 [Chloroflexi bacterium]|nr:hypothetical protein [Chloroflexota bacterium]